MLQTQNRKIQLRKQNVDVTLEIEFDDGTKQELPFMFKQPSQFELIDIIKVLSSESINKLQDQKKEMDGLTEDEIKDKIAEDMEDKFDELLEYVEIFEASVHVMSKKLLKAPEWKPDGDESALEYLMDLDDDIQQTLINGFMQKAMPSGQKKWRTFVVGSTTL